MGDATCRIPDCDKPVFIKKRGLCKSHYKRWVKYGDPTSTGRPASTTYNAVHLRLKARRGNASTHPCARCGAPAIHWAYDNAAPDELIAEGIGPYSTDLSHYEPLCRLCHSAQDGARRAAERTLCQRGLHPFPENRVFMGRKRKACCRLCFNAYNRRRQQASKES